MSKLPETKKSLFYLMENSLFQDYYKESKDLELTGLHSRNGVFVLTGPRKVGKSTLLKQLCEKYDGNYFNVERLSNSVDSDTNLEFCLEEFKRALNCEKRLVCLDEITKMPDALYWELSDLLKSIDNKIVIITGSIPKSVKDFAEIIGDKEVFEMHPLDYWEYCNWYDKTLGEDSYRDYLSFKQFKEIRGIEEYARLVLKDSITSYSYNSVRNEEIAEDVLELLDEHTFTDCIKLICLSGQMKLSRKGSFEDIPRLRQLNSKEYSEYKRLKRIKLMDKEKIISLQKFLVDTGLGEYVNCYCYNDEQLKTDCSLCHVGSTGRFLTFEFPCFGSTVFNKLVTEDDFDFNHQCEVDVFNDSKRLFSYVGKFRDSDNAEIDFMSFEVLIEVKNSPLNHVNKYIYGYTEICNNTEIDNLIVTTSDSVLDLSVVNGVKVLKVNLPLLAYTLGELQTVPDARELLKYEPAEVLYNRMKGGI